ncbi:MAG: hypothetical protein A3E82_06470 [Gammaproteobacteria bacterium RIFCSPHIGHO2_12_FULL_38_11]|nr:MAG: hypothetical protein A3E82_06470 [Gammaproteobacteria bacterium RIFCSPHIGHO2_12_FULL_38_11]
MGRILFCIVMGSALGSCVEYQQSTSYYGSGSYHCFYQNRRTLAVYKTIEADKYQSVLTAKKDCRMAAVNENDETQCEFKECVFK